MFPNFANLTTEERAQLAAVVQRVTENHGSDFVHKVHQASIPEEPAT